jgi:putative ABC transport system permease protein
MTPQWHLSVAVALQTLRANSLHTMLSTLGIIIGVASLVAILALGDGMERFARQQIESTTDLTQISVQTRTTETIGDVLVRRTDAPSLTVADAAALRALLANAGRVSLHTSAGVELRLPGDTARSGVLVHGTLADAGRTGDLVLVAGRFFSNDEVAAAERVVVLDARLATRLAPVARAALERSVLLGGAQFRVIGVVAPGERGPAAAYLPLSTIGATSPSAAERLPSLTVLANEVEDVPGLRTRVERWLGERFGARASAFAVVTNERRVDQARRGILMFKLVMGTITGISIVVGGIGVMNVLLVSIVERTREIGIRKATGARRRDIAVQFLTESVTISGFGSVLGVLLGFAMVFSFAPIVRAVVNAPFQPAVTVSSIVVALLAAVAVGLLFGTYPALRAARLQPVDAIRHE